MRALVVVNPAATSTTAKMRDVLVGALASELKLDVAETAPPRPRPRAGRPGRRRRHRPRRRRRRRRHRQRGGQRAARARALAAACRCSPSSRAAPPTSSPGRSAARATRWRRPPRSSTRCAPAAPGSCRSAPPRASGTEDAGPTGGPTPRWFVFAAGLGFDAEVIARVEAPAGRRDAAPPAPSTCARRSPPSCSAASAAARPMTLQLPGEPPVEDLFLCLVSNVSPWTYLGARPVNPVPEASFDAGLDVFAMSRVGAAADAAHARARRWPASPTPRGRGVHRRHDLEELRSPPRGRWAGSSTATTWHGDRPAGRGTCRRRCAWSPERARRPASHARPEHACQRPRTGVWFRRVAGLARPW